MAKCTLTVTIAPRWWVAPYLNMLMFLCHVFNCEPDREKVAHIVCKGYYIK